MGGEPQDVKFRGEHSRLIVGDDNLIREGVTIRRASGEEVVHREAYEETGVRVTSLRHFGSEDLRFYK